MDNQDRREVLNNSDNNDLTKDDLRSISTSDFLKIEDKKLRDFLRSNRFPTEYNVDKIKNMITNGDISPYSLVEYLEDSNSL